MSLVRTLCFGVGCCDNVSFSAKSQGAGTGLNVGEENWEPASFEMIPIRLKFKGKRVGMHPCEPSLAQLEDECGGFDSSLNKIQNRSDGVFLHKASCSAYL